MNEAKIKISTEEKLSPEENDQLSGLLQKAGFTAVGPNTFPGGLILTLQGPGLECYFKRNDGTIVQFGDLHRLILRNTSGEHSIATAVHPETVADLIKLQLSLNALLVDFANKYVTADDMVFEIVRSRGGNPERKHETKK